MRLLSSWCRCLLNEASDLFCPCSFPSPTSSHTHQHARGCSGIKKYQRVRYLCFIGKKADSCFLFPLYFRFMCSTGEGKGGALFRFSTRTIFFSSPPCARARSLSRAGRCGRALPFLSVTQTPASCVCHPAPEREKGERGTRAAAWELFPPSLPPQHGVATNPPRQGCSTRTQRESASNLCTKIQKQASPMKRFGVPDIQAP